MGLGLALLHFSNKEFEILDLDPPINATSHYGACHFSYNLALNALCKARKVLCLSPHSVGQGLVPLHFLNKEFEILDIDPPINASSHYGACHFRYNLALKKGGCP